MKIKKIYEQVVDDNQPILVKGIGQYTYGSLKKDIVKKIQDMLVRAQKDDFQSLADANLETLIHLWRTISAFKSGEKPPNSTKLSEF